MAYAPSKTYFGQDGTILGCFTEKDHSNLFEFSVNDDNCDWAPANFVENYPHKVWVTTPREGIDSGYRYARVKKTVAYILIDEAADDSPILERWFIKDFNQYMGEA